MKGSTRTKRRWLWLCAGGIVAYVVLLLLLLWVERMDPNASIQSFADAFWYSVVTLSTVGYGDLYPVTAAGRILGALFVLMSVGLLSFIITAAIGILSGRLLPALQLRFTRNRQWWVFSCLSDGAMVLAEDLAETYPDSIFLFPQGEQKLSLGQGRCLYYPGSIEQAVAGKKDKCSLFFMDPDSTNEYDKAVAALQTGHPVYCLTEYAPDLCPEGLTLFNRYDCCAREYWRSNGLEKAEKKILLIGDGKYARRLLERGLLLHVFAQDRVVQYHVFGDWKDFCRNHHRLGETLSIDVQVPGKDCLFFHTDAWNEDSDLLEQADRILICHDEEEENIAVLCQLRQFFPTKAKVHLRSMTDLANERVFGTNKKIYTADQVIRSIQSRAARTMHRIYCGSTGAADGWEQLSEFARQSNVAAAEHLLTKIRILLEDDSISHITAENCAAAAQRYRQTRQEKKDTYRWIEHQRWMRFHSMYNWKYDALRNNQTRHHPLMVPFEDLTPADQQKDDFAWELLEQIAQYC